MPVVPGLEGIYFPKVPYPKEGMLIPLDEKKQVVTTDNIQIQAVIVPYWYWKLVEDYMIKTDTAVTALMAVQHPP